MFHTDIADVSETQTLGRGPGLGCMSSGKCMSLSGFSFEALNVSRD